MFLDQYLRKYPKWRKWRGLPEPMTPEMAKIMREAWSLLAAPHLGRFADQCKANALKEW